MVEFRISVNPKQRVAYFPKEIVEALGFRLTAVPNRSALVLYPEGMNVAQVVRSVEIILADLRYQEEMERSAEAGAVAGAAVGEAAGG